jgi:hypothetical protein
MASTYARVAGTVLILFMTSAVARAQSAASATPQPRTGLKWEFSAYGGPLDADIPIQGIPTNFPEQNPLFVTVNGNLTRSIPTWFFANGASLHGLVATQAQTPERITSLDDVAYFPSSRRANAWVIGARIGRILNPRVTLEGMFEHSRARLELPAETTAAIEATRASFGPAWTGLLGSEPATFQNVEASATSEIRAGATHQTVVHGTLVINILTRRRNIPYVFVGGGAMIHGGTGPEVTLTGRVRTMLNGTVPIDETDTMTLAYTINRTVASASVGVGLKRMMGERWGLRVEMRQQLSSNPMTHVVGAAPTRVVAVGTSDQGAASTSRFTALQYSNFPTSPESSLGGGLSNFLTFGGTGMESRLSLTGGIFWRF